MKRLAPGIALCLLLASAAVGIAELPWSKTHLRFSPLLVVILLGMGMGSFVSLPPIFKEGIAYCQKPVLRLGVALLGIKLSLMKIVEIGGSVLTIIVVVTVAGFFFAVLLGRLVGLGKKPTLLLATGGSICGASAIVAADTVIKGENKDAAVSLAVITLWGTVGIFAYPALVHLTPHAFGVFCGATLHEVAQVVAAAGQSQDVAMVTKLARVCLLAPTIIGLGWYIRRVGDGAESGERATLVPWFLWAFLAMATLRTASPSIGVEAQAKWFGDFVVPLVLSVGMAGVGLQTKLREVVQAGWKPIFVGLLQWIAMAGLTIGLIAWLMPQ